MIKWGMEILSPASYLHNPNWFLEENTSTNWTHDENKLFENTLAIYDNDTPDRWHKIAAMIPGKTIFDVKRHYKELLDDVSDIEAGLVPIPGYTTSSLNFEFNNRGFDGFKQSCGAGAKRSSSGRNPDQERKKGVPWTEDEHRQFLMGLKKYGKGDWRNISRNFVITRTPTQVASHAQKYFIRLSSGGKDKRRSSIHDITTVNFTDNRPPSPAQSTATSGHPSSAAAPKTTENFSLLFNAKQPNEERSMVFSTMASQTHGNLFMPPPYGISPYGLKLQGHNLHRGAPHESQIRSPNTVFQFQSSHTHLHR